MCSHPDFQRYTFRIGKWRRRFPAMAAACCLMVSCKPEPGSMVFPDSEWLSDTPESQGFDREKFREVIDWYGKNTPHGGSREMIVIRRGRAIWTGSDVDQVHNVWSCTKTFTSTVLGLLVDEGVVSLDTPLAEFLPEMKAAYPDATFRHFVTMTSGYQAEEDQPPFGTYVNGPSSVWWRPAPEPLFPPGTRYAYWDSAMNQLGYAMETASGRKMKEIFEKGLADRIGMDPRGWDWKEIAVEGGVRVNGGAGNKRKGIHICAREMARLGHLFLNQGRWKGRQILSREWVEQATSVQVPQEMPLGGPLDHGIPGTGFPKDGGGMYGFAWWVNGLGPDGKRLMEGAPKGAYGAKGFNNNVLLAIPEWEMVICRLGQDQIGGFKITEEFIGEFVRRLGKAMVK